MGCGASTPQGVQAGFATGTAPGPKPKPTKSTSSAGDATDASVADEAARLDWLLGYNLEGPEEARAHAMQVIGTYFRGQFERNIAKRIDLTHCVDHHGAIVTALDKRLNAVLKKTNGELLASLATAFRTLHERVLPKACLGFAGIYHKLGGKRPRRYAYDQGCRAFDIIDPFEKEVHAVFQKTGMADEMASPPEWWHEFAGVDMSETVLVSGAMPIVLQGQQAKVGAHMVRESFERLRAEAAPFIAEHGLPLVDVYIMNPICAFSFPDFHGHGCFSDFWREAEKLVDEGLVRSLGLNNSTIHQIEATLQFARHRPVVHTFEQHILNQAPEMVAFCKANGIAPRAHVCLAKGDVFESACLQRDDMSAPQAALKWNIQQGVSACFGVDTLAHMVENFKMQTQAMIDLPPVVALPPARPLMKLYPMFSMNMPGMMMKSGDRTDTGILRKDDDGRYWAASSAAAGERWLEKLAKMSEGQESLIREIESAIIGIKRQMPAVERRAAIAAAVASLGKEGMTDEARMAAIQAAVQKSAENKTDMDDELTSAFHQITSDSGAKGLTSMVVVPLSTFRSQGRIPRRSIFNQTHYHVEVSKLKPGDKVLFFSQRWLTPSPRATASPDDAPGGTKYKQLMKACEAYCKAKGVREENIYLWLDFSSIDQDDEDGLVRGVNSLALYVCSSDAFVSIDHADYFDRGWCLMECMFADCSKVPRFKFTTRRHLTEARNELLELRPDMRLENKKPEEGNFTVEADREIMKVLTFMAQVITHKLDRGGSFGLLDAKDFEEKGMLRGQSVEEIVKEDSKVKRGESLDSIAKLEEDSKKNEVPSIGEPSWAKQ